MGATDRMLRRMILLQAFTAGSIGFGLGAGLIGLFALLNRNSSDLSMTLNWQLLCASGSAVILIILMAALISIRKVMKLEPAIVFKG
jgi:putative ABC transport system permease protein